MSPAAPAAGNWQRTVRFGFTEVPSHTIQKTHLKTAQLDYVGLFSQSTQVHSHQERTSWRLGRFREEQSRDVCSQGAHS